MGGMGLNEYVGNPWRSQKSKMAKRMEDDREERL